MSELRGHADRVAPVQSVAGRLAARAATPGAIHSRVKRRPREHTRRRLRRTRHKSVLWGFNMITIAQPVPRGERHKHPRPVTRVAGCYMFVIRRCVSSCACHWRGKYCGPSWLLSSSAAGADADLPWQSWSDKWQRVAVSVVSCNGRCLRRDRGSHLPPSGSHQQALIAP